MSLQVHLKRHFEGLLRNSKRNYFRNQVNMNKIHTNEDFSDLWAHEMLRIFYDRIADQKDRDFFLSLIGKEYAEITS